MILLYRSYSVSGSIGSAGSSGSAGSGTVGSGVSLIYASRLIGGWFTRSAALPPLPLPPLPGREWG